MRLIQLVAGLAFLGLALALGRHAASLSYYSSLGPGPGFFPLWLCGGLGVLAVLLVVTARLRPVAAPEDFWPEREGWPRLAAIVCCLSLVPLAMPVLGFRLTMAAFGAALMLGLGVRRPLSVIGVAALAGPGVHAVFTRVLGVPLPVGQWGI